MNKEALISFASKGREDYNKAQARNIESAIAQGFDGEFIYYSLDQPREVSGVQINGGLPKDCPSHQDVPYGFKPWLFKEAFDKGFTCVIWLDSTIVCAKNPSKMFDECRKRGVLAFHNLGHNLYKYISDDAIKTTGVDLVLDTYQIMACVVGFDYEHPTGKRIFDRWLELAQDGESFQENESNHAEFIAHRHDQAVLSALLWQEKHKLLAYGSLVYEPHNTTFEHGKDFYFINKAI